MLMRLGLSLNSRLLVLSVGPVRMFSVLGVENSRSVLSAITSRIGVELPLDRFGCDWWNLLVNQNQSCNTLDKIWTDKNKGKPTKADVQSYDIINKYLFDQFSFSLVPPQQWHQKCLLTFLSIATKNRVLNLLLATTLETCVGIYLWLIIYM
jgi:hypothetical protein